MTSVATATKLRIISVSPACAALVRVVASTVLTLIALANRAPGAD
jgi:hypothetical protein